VLSFPRKFESSDTITLSAGPSQRTLMPFGGPNNFPPPMMMPMQPQQQLRPHMGMNSGNFPGGVGVGGGQSMPGFNPMFNMQMASHARAPGMKDEECVHDVIGCEELFADM
jgi:hypothetical protein